jgi:hypothetical protein
LFQNNTKKNGKLSAIGKDWANRFTCGGNYTGGCGVLVGTSGRPGVLQPANLANGDAVFTAIAYNENTKETQTGTAGVAGDAVAAGVGQVIAPVSIFIHESAENVAFEKQGSAFDHGKAHSDAIGRESQIRKDLNIGGGFAGGFVESVAPK